MIPKLFSRIIRPFIFRLNPTILSSASKFCFSELKVGSGKDKVDDDKLWGDEQWEGDTKWTEHIQQIVPNFPFAHIPIGVIRNPLKFNIPNQHLHNLIAFKLLRAHQQDIVLAAKFLFHNQKNQAQSFSMVGGRRIFSQFYGPKCKSLIKNLNGGAGSMNERITTLLILSNMEVQEATRQQVKLIDIRAISQQDSTGILIAYCAQVLIWYNLEYSHLLQLILSKLQDPKNSLENKARISKAIISTAQFENYFSRKLLDLTLQTIAHSLPNMHNYQILFVIRNVYNFRSQAAKNLAITVQQHLIKKHIDENNLDFHVPLILKSIKYASKVGASTKELLAFVEVNMKRFQVIFDKKREAKGIFFSLLFSKPNKQASPQLIGHLKGYFLNGLGELVKSNECQQSELLRFNKLLLKYFQHFSQKEQQYIKNQYIQKIIPYFSESTQVLFYSILIFLRTKPDQSSQLACDPVKKYIIMFLERCCNKNNAEELFVVHHINSVVEMMYQVLRHNIKLQKSQMPLICRYDFSKKESINPENLSYFFYYLAKTQHESRQDVKGALQSIEPLLQVYIRGHKIHSFKTVMNIIDVCSKVGFEHDFFYKLLQNTIAEYLINNPKFVIFQKDLKFINQKFIKRGYGSAKLKELILGTLERPKNWQKLRQAYTQNQKKFLDSVNRKRKQRQYEMKDE